MTKEDFKKFAKEEFGYDISFEKSDEPDTFESLFGELSKNIKVGDEVADDFHKENVVLTDNRVIRKSRLVAKVLDEIKEEIKDNTYFINETTEKEGIDFETVEKIIDKYKVESEE